MLTPNTLIRAGVSPARAKAHAEAAGAAMREFGLVDATECRMFLAQALHETGGLVFMSELWGPTAAQLTYVGRMGNRTLAEAFRYRGRGTFQLTGRDNYGTYGRALGVDLLGRPELAAEPKTAWRIAGTYWRARVHPRGTPMPSFEEVTRRINGGLNGFADRLLWLRRLAGLGVVPGPDQSERCKFLRQSVRTWTRRRDAAVRALKAGRFQTKEARAEVVAERKRAGAMVRRRKRAVRVRHC